jgi:tetrahydromethanopterin S-methyltransferase subunit B
MIDIYLKKMNKMNWSKRNLLILSFVFIFGAGMVKAQTMPEVMEKGSLPEQMDYMKEKTSIYNGYRAVRDDIYLKMIKNSLDSLGSAKTSIQELNSEIKNLNDEKAKLTNNLDARNAELQDAIKNRDSLFLFGAPMNKALYNSIVWLIIAGLIFLLVITVLFYQRSRKVTISSRNDLEELKQEFDAYKVKARESREEMVVKHFNEIQKIKEGR